MSKSTWFEKHTMQVRRSPWAVRSPVNDTEATTDDADPDSGTRPSMAAAALVPAESLEASETRLTGAIAELADAEARATTLRAEIADAQARATEAQQALEQVTRTMLADAEPELVKLAFAIAERIVGRELATSPELIVAWARDALAASSLGEGLVIAVASDVADDVDPSQWGALGPRVITDGSLPPATCELRDGKTTVTVGGGERLDLAREQLAGVGAREAA